MNPVVMRFVIKFKNNFHFFFGERLLLKNSLNKKYLLYHNYAITI